MTITGVLEIPILRGHEAAIVDEPAWLLDAPGVRVEPFARPGMLDLFVEAPSVEALAQAFRAPSRLREVLERHTAFTPALWREFLSLDVALARPGGPFSRDNRQQLAEEREGPQVPEDFPQYFTMDNSR